MKTGIELQGAATLHLAEALLIYRSDNEPQTRHSYVTFHQIIDGKTFGPAKPLTHDFVVELSRSIGKGMELELLPENVLVRTPETIVWWTAPQLRKMFFTGDRVKQFPQLSGKTYPQPPLVWMASGQSLSVRALADCQRPTAQTPLYLAPYWNVSDRGDVCLGDMATPESSSVQGITVWEDGFFQSNFTHPNATKIVDYRNGYLNMLSEFLTFGFKAFDPHYLIDAKQTLAQFIQGGRE